MPMFAYTAHRYDWKNYKGKSRGKNQQLVISNYMVRDTM